MIKSKVLKAFVCGVLVACLLSTSIYAYPSAGAVSDVLTNNPEVTDECKIGGGNVDESVDVDGKENITVTDALKTLQEVSGLIKMTEPQFRSADTNYDNKITVNTFYFRASDFLSIVSIETCKNTEMCIYYR